MMDEKLQTIIIGGGQAGLSLSYFLTNQGHEHVVFEKAERIGEAWRNHRWDSFNLLTPNWTFLLPGAEYQENQPDAFMAKSEVVRRFEDYTEKYHLPVKYSTNVNLVETAAEGKYYRVHTGEQAFLAKNVIMATGLFQKAKIPGFSARIPGSILQLESGQYRSPQALPPGAVLVVGSAQSGCQIAEELNLAGRKVYLSTGSAGRFPRRYRGKDGMYWAKQIGFFDRTPDNLPSPRARFAGNPHLSGKDGGHAINLHQFCRDGIQLLGHFRGFESGKLTAAPDLKDNLTRADQVEANFFRMFDEYIAREAIDAPKEELNQLIDGFGSPEILSLDLGKENIGVIIWACGFSFDFSFVRFPVFDEFGYPVTTRGKTRFPGLYFLGLPWLYKFKSGLLMGVGEDAAYLADQIIYR
jgi:putative flavoprotein involved in K+ transport